jgi:Na+/melibiose symporter-like transporter
MENSFEEIDLEAENAELRDRVAKREAEAKKLADAVMALKKRPAGAQPELFLILLALACVGRLVLYANVEGMGTRAKLEGMGVTSGFVALSLVTLVVWALHEWRASHWLTIAKAIVLCVGLRIAVDLWTSGDATAATLMAVVTLLGMALPVFGWVITTLTDAITDPMRLFRK